MVETNEADMAKEVVIISINIGTEIQKKSG